MYQPSNQNPNNLAGLIKPLLTFGLGLGVVFVVLVAIAGNQIGELVKAFAIFAALVVAVLFIVVLLLGASSKPIGAIGDVQLEIARESHRHVEEMARLGLLPKGDRSIPSPVVPQIAAPKPKPLDPRHPLLVELCLMTIRSRDPKYGPASNKLMSADDAQAESKRGNRTFADRNEWDKASKYGQEPDQGWLYTKIGGSEQGLMIKSAGNNTAADLMTVLMERNTALKSAVSALPEEVR